MVDIMGHKGYKINKKGEIFSFRWPNKPRKLKPYPRGKGKYPAVGLLIDNKNKKDYSVHRLVAQHFVSGYFEGAVVNHIDENKENYHFTNLEWVSQETNVHKYFDYGS